jgi:hypothetical protein
MLVASGASAAADSHLSETVDITSQNVAGDQCQWGVKFSVTITNSGSPVTVTSVNSGNYPLSDNGGLAAGTVLKSGTNKFTKLASDDGPFLNEPGCFPLPAPPPLVLTVDTSAGSVTWNQSVSDPQVVTEPEPAGVKEMPGSFDVANCSEYYFQYGVTTSYGKQGDLTTSCANDGTQTQYAYFTPTLVPSTGYHYRLVVIESNGTKLCGQDEFYTGGDTSLPVGSVGLIGVGALAGCVLFVAQRRRRNRKNA